MARLTLNLKTSGPARRVTRNGVPHLVAPVVMIVPGVLPGSRGALYYPPDEIRRNHSSWHGVPLTLRHPTLPDGTPVSAGHAGVPDGVKLGTLENPSLRGDGALVGEAWFDEAKTRAADGRVHSALLSGTPFEVSTGLFTDNEPAPPGAACPRTGRSYDAVAKNYRPDHLAVLPDQTGACSVRDGCGLNLNARREVTANAKRLWPRPVPRDDMGAAADKLHHEADAASETVPTPDMARYLPNRDVPAEHRAARDKYLSAAWAHEVASDKAGEAGSFLGAAQHKTRALRARAAAAYHSHAAGDANWRDHYSSPLFTGEPYRSPEGVTGRVFYGYSHDSPRVETDAIQGQYAVRDEHAHALVRDAVPGFELRSIEGAAVPHPRVDGSTAASMTAVRTSLRKAGWSAPARGHGKDTQTFENVYGHRIVVGKPVAKNGRRSVVLHARFGGMTARPPYGHERPLSPTNFPAWNARPSTPPARPAPSPPTAREPIGLPSGPGPLGGPPGVVTSNRLARFERGLTLNGDLSPGKACQILKDGSVNDRKLTRKQQRFFGAVCGGERPRTENARLPWYTPEWSGTFETPAPRTRAVTAADPPPPRPDLPAALNTIFGRSHA